MNLLSLVPSWWRIALAAGLLLVAYVTGVGHGTNKVTATLERERAAAQIGAERGAAELRRADRDLGRRQAHVEIGRRQRGQVEQLPVPVALTAGEQAEGRDVGREIEIAGGKRQIMTAEPTTVFEIDRAIFSRLLKNNPEIVVALSQLVLKRFLSQEEQGIESLHRVHRQHIHFGDLLDQLGLPFIKQVHLLLLAGAPARGVSWSTLPCTSSSCSAVSVMCSVTISSVRACLTSSSAILRASCCWSCAPCGPCWLNALAVYCIWLPLSTVCVVVGSGALCCSFSWRSSWRSSSVNLVDGALASGGGGVTDATAVSD